MSGSGTFLEVTQAELDTGIAYAQEKYHVRIDRDMLRTIANKTGRRRTREGLSFEDARYQALREHLTQRDRDEASRRSAYSAAVGKIFSGRRIYKARTAQRVSVRQPVKASSSPVTSLNEMTGQYELRI